MPSPDRVRAAFELKDGRLWWKRNTAKRIRSMPAGCIHKGKHEVRLDDRLYLHDVLLALYLSA